MRKIAVALLLGTLAFTGRIALAQGEQSLEQAIESAKTPADHEAIAKEFQSKAQAARSEASLHEKMASAYDRGPVKLTQANQAKEHCRKIIQSNKAIAKEYDALAKIHEDAAKKKP